MKSRDDLELSTTAYAILGMLAIRPYSPYELIKQFDRTLGRVWPRARSKLFELPKRLVKAGYARTSAGATGNRRRTIYTITAKGRRALAAWLEEPGGHPELEFEQLMKVFFAEQGTKAAAVTNLKAAQEWARADLAEHATVGRGYLERTGSYPERLPQLVLTGTFLSELTLLVERWSTWALGVVEEWPDDLAEAAPNLEALEEITQKVERAMEAQRAQPPETTSPRRRSRARS
jgi:DNA-binding PadR family transcriptional regulator